MTYIGLEVAKMLKLSCKHAEAKNNSKKIKARHPSFLLLYGCSVFIHNSSRL